MVLFCSTVPTQKWAQADATCRQGASISQGAAPGGEEEDSLAELLLMMDSGDNLMHGSIGQVGGSLYPACVLPFQKWLREVVWGKHKPPPANSMCHYFIGT